jgi:hypothetical protein
VGEFEAHFFAARTVEKARAMFANEPRLELRRHTEVIEHLERHRQKRFSQMKPGKLLFLEDGYAESGAG